MGMNDWVMLVPALGGIEGIKQLIKINKTEITVRIKISMILLFLFFISFQPPYAE